MPVRSLRPIGLHRTLLLIGFALAFTLAGGAAWVVLDRRAADLAAAEHENSGLAAALAEQTSLTFSGADYVLRDLVERIHAGGVATPEALAARMGTPDIQRMLRTEIAGLSQIDAASVVGADGSLINYSRKWPVADTILADRDYFRHLRDDPSLGLFIGEPVTSRGTGTSTIYLARRVLAPDGRFLGVVLAAIRLDYFANLYRSVAEEKGRIVALRRRDGVLLARYPQSDEARGAVPAGDELFPAIAGGAPIARSLSHSAIDGTLRLRTARALKDFPLVVVVARTEAAVLGAWRRQTAAIGGGAALGAVALLLAIALLARQIARREASEVALAATLEHISQGIMMIDADRRVPVSNRRVREMLDLPAELMEAKPAFDDILRYQWAHEEFGPDGAAVEPPLRSFIRSGGVSNEVHGYERRRPDGTVLEISSIPLPGGGAVRTYTDVTVAREREAALLAALHQRDKAEAAFPAHRDTLEREMAERARPLAASEARHRDVAEVASDWIWETDADLRFTFVSKRFGDTSGIPWAAVVGLGFGDLVTLGFDRAGMAELRTTIAARGIFQNVVHRVVPMAEPVCSGLTHAGAAHFWRMSGMPFVDADTGAFAGYRGTGTDVTAAIEQAAELNAIVLRAEAAELAARQSRTRLVEAIEAIPEGFVLHDAADRLVLCNARYGEIYGLTPELMTPGVRFEDSLRATAQRDTHALDGEDVETWVAKRLARHRSVDGGRFELRLANGRWLQVDERRTSDGGTVGTRIDVTEARLREGAEREREKLAALGQLAGGVAHEINNLLQPAITLPEMVRDRLPPDDLESREDLDCVMEGARKVREIVRNILLFARKEEPRLASLDLVTELRAALGFVRDLMPPSVTVREENLDAHLGGRVAANKTQLTQVLTNLLVNAAQATKDTGTVTVTVARTRPTVEAAELLSIEAGREYFAVAVADTGSGMDAATQAHIFEPFFTTKPVGQGTGLGLSVAYGILRSWQGAITVRSILGEGTVFVLHVPVLLAADL